MEFDKRRLYFLSLFFLAVLFPNGGNSLKVRFFEWEQNEVFQSQSLEQCTNLPSWMKDKGYLAKSDGCIILYTGNHCTDFSVKLDATEDKINVYDILGNKTPASFHPCNDTEGGAQVNVDFYTDTADEKYPSDDHIAAQLRDLCSCTKLTSGIKSLNNHGNCVELFDDDQCTKNGVKIPAGKSSKSSDLNRHGINDKKSVKACQEPPHCLKLIATVTKFEIQDSQDKNLLRFSKTWDVQLATKGTFINNGNATVTQEYLAKKRVQEITSIKRLQSLSTMQSVNVSGSVQFVNKFGLSFIDQAKLAVSFAAGYNFTKTSTSETAEEHRITESKEFQATQKIEIPPCTSYEINSFVKFTEKFPLQYNIYTMISGRLGDDRLKGAEIAKRLTDMQWVKDVDAYTIIAKGKATASIDFGMASYVNGTSVPAGCKI